MSLRQFVSSVAHAERSDAASGRSRYYLHSPLAWTPRDDDPSTEGRYAGRRVGGHFETIGGGDHMAHLPLGAGLADDLKRRIDWKWLVSMCKAAGAESVNGCSLWLGHGRGCTPLHVDGGSGVLAQIRGRKRVLLFLPSESANLYPYPCGHDKDTYSQIDVEQPDLKRLPNVVHARGLEAILEPGERHRLIPRRALDCSTLLPDAAATILEPGESVVGTQDADTLPSAPPELGDVLTLPAYVWHYVRQLGAGEENISLSFGVSDDRSMMPPLPDATPSLENVLAAAIECKAAHQAACHGSATERDDDAHIREAHSDLGLRCMLAARWIEERAAEAAGGHIKGGRLLTALAAGEDAGRGGSGEIGPVNSESHMLATKLRFELMAYVGDAKTANAVLRAATRGGRLLAG